MPASCALSHSCRGKQRQSLTVYCQQQRSVQEGSSCNPEVHTRSTPVSLESKLRWLWKLSDKTVSAELLA